MLRSKDPITPGNPLRADAWASCRTNLDGALRTSRGVKKKDRKDPEMINNLVHKRKKMKKVPKDDENKT